MKLLIAVLAVFVGIACSGWADAKDESATLEQRVKQLEDRLDALGPSEPGGDLRVRSLIIVDDKGTPRVSLSPSGLLVHDAQRRERIALGLESHQALLRFKARTGATRLQLALMHGDAPYVVLRNPGTSVRLEAPHGGAAGLTIRSGPGSQNECSHAGFSIWDDGTIAWGGGHRSGGHAGFHLVMSRDGELDFRIRDHEQALLWEAQRRDPPTPFRKIDAQSNLRSADPAKQRQAISELSAILSGNEPELIGRALNRLSLTRGVAYDRAAMETLVRKYLDSDDGVIRIAALNALRVVRADKGGDLDSAIRVATTEEFAVLRRVALPLIGHADGEVVGAKIEVPFLRLLRHERIEVTLAAVKALSRARTSIAIQKELIRLWRKYRERYHDVVRAIAHVRPRSSLIIKANVEELSLRDTHSLHGKTLMALEHPDGDQAEQEAVAGALQLLPDLDSERSQVTLVNIVTRLGTSSDADKLEAIVETQKLSEAIVGMIEKALPSMRER